MTTDPISALIACQDALIAALDIRDVTSIEETTAALAAAIETLRNSDVMMPGPTELPRINVALQRCDAAQTRVNYLSNAVQDRQVHLSERRGRPRSMVYSPAGLQRKTAEM